MIDTSKLLTIAENEQKVYEAGQQSITWKDRVKDLIDFRNAAYLFYSGGSKLTEAPLKYSDTENATDFTSMFYNCDCMREAPHMNTSKGTAFNTCFRYCTALKTIPSYDLTKATDLTMFVGYCYGLTNVPDFNLGTNKRGVKYTSLFNNCTALVTVGQLDLGFASAKTDTATMFNSCKSLENVYVKNIRFDLQVGSGTSYGHKLTLECLLRLIKEVINSGSAIKLSMGSANLAKLEGIYVKLIDVTEEMRTEDEFIDNKYPFKVCESTDEGAMLLKTEYVALKNLTLQ